MPLSNIVLNDGTANHTFVVVQNQAGVGELEERVDGRPDLSSVLTLSNARIQTGRRFKLKLAVPVIRTDANALPQKVDTVIINMDMRLPSVSKTTDRALARKLLKAAVDNAQILALIDDALGVS